MSIGKYIKVFEKLLSSPTSFISDEIKNLEKRRESYRRVKNIITFFLILYSSPIIIALIFFRRKELFIQFITSIMFILLSILILRSIITFLLNKLVNDLSKEQLKSLWSYLFARRCIILFLCVLTIITTRIALFKNPLIFIFVEKFISISSILFIILESRIMYRVLKSLTNIYRTYCYNIIYFYYNLVYINRIVIFIRQHVKLSLL